MPRCEQCRSWPKCRNFFGDGFRNNTTCDWDPSHFAYSAKYVQDLEATIAGLTENNTRLTAEKLQVETMRDQMSQTIKSLEMMVNAYREGLQDIVSHTDADAGYLSDLTCFDEQKLLPSTRYLLSGARHATDVDQKEQPHA
jgi:hypothetical protein